MSNQLKIALVVIAICANVAVFFWRFASTSEALPVAPRKPLEFGEQQASLLLEWTRAERVPLSKEGIDTFVDQIAWGSCIRVPAPMEVLPPEAVAEGVKDEFRIAAKGLISAYTEGTPEALASYMLERGQRLSPPMARELRQLLLTDGGFPEDELEELDDHRLLVTFAKEAKYAPHWTALAKGTACAVIWQVPKNSLASRPETLGSEIAGLFKNQTRFNHLFVDTDESVGGMALGYTQTSPAFTYYGDFRFVVEHDEEFLREVSPYFVRFGFNREDAIWQPLELIHVATSSGNSPILIF